MSSALSVAGRGTIGAPFLRWILSRAALFSRPLRALGRRGSRHVHLNIKMAFEKVHGFLRMRERFLFPR